MIRTKRIYDRPDKGDGFRILVDRLWPRGLSKDKAKVDLWLKDIAPSNELRRWFSHDINKWTEFQKRYEQELESKEELINKIRKIEKENKTVTLLYSAKDTSYNNAVVLRDYLKS
ncbi:MAG: DUF488 domain-containing protein [Acidobacteriota bacterium]